MPCQNRPPPSTFILIRFPSSTGDMAFNQLAALLPEELATSFTGTNAIFSSGISKCVARDDSVQINGHVAGTIQYMCVPAPHVCHTSLPIQHLPFYELREPMTYTSVYIDLIYTFINM